MHTSPSETVVKSVGFGAMLLGFRFWPCYLLPRASCFISRNPFLRLLNEDEISSISLTALLWELHELMPTRGLAESLENRKHCLRSSYDCASSYDSI